MRLVDGDALIDKYGEWYTEEGTEEGYIGTIKGIVDSMPTIEPERKTGRWIEVKDSDNSISGKCSECGWEAHMYEDDVFGMDYCPNCGARLLI